MVIIIAVTAAIIRIRIKIFSPFAGAFIIGRKTTPFSDFSKVKSGFSIFSFSEIRPKNFCLSSSSLFTPISISFKTFSLRGISFFSSNFSIEGFLTGDISSFAGSVIFSTLLYSSFAFGGMDPAKGVIFVLSGSAAGGISANFFFPSSIPNSKNISISPNCFFNLSSHNLVCCSFDSISFSFVSICPCFSSKFHLSSSIFFLLSSNSHLLIRNFLCSVIPIISFSSFSINFISPSILFSPSLISIRLSSIFFIDSDKRSFFVSNSF